LIKGRVGVHVQCMNQSGHNCSTFVIKVAHKRVFMQGTHMLSRYQCLKQPDHKTKQYIPFMSANGGSWR
jgi:hypothetical protein